MSDERPAETGELDTQLFLEKLVATGDGSDAAQVPEPASDSVPDDRSRREDG